MRQSTVVGVGHPPVLTSEVEAASAAIQEMMSETMFFLHSSARRHGLTLLQLMVLRFIEVKGPQAPSQLAEQFGISRPAVTSSINILESNGWVERTRPEGDRRRLRTSLTARSEQILRRVAAERRQFLEKGLSRLPPRTQSEFTRAARLLVRELRTDRAVADPPPRSAACR